VAVLSPAGEVEISNQQARLHFGLEPGRKQSDTQLQWLADLFAGAISTGHQIDRWGINPPSSFSTPGQERFLLPRAVPIV